MSNPFRRPTANLRELYERYDAMEDAGEPQWKLDNLARIIADVEQQRVELGSGRYLKTSERVTGEISGYARDGAKLTEDAEAVRDDLRDGRITPTEAAKQLAAIQRRVNVLRKQIDLAVTSEEQAWESVDCTPDEYEDAIIRRIPSLGPRMRVVIDEDELNQPPVRRGRRRAAPAEGVDEDDLTRGGYPSRRQS